MDYNSKTIETKWEKKWQKAKIYQVDLKNPKKKFYNLMMFPYPSAEGLHVGNMYAFTGADFYGRYKAMNGYQVFEPIGLDGFGIHSENYAIQIAKHPADQAKISEKHFYEQLSRIGNRFSWENRLETYDPEYYKWTQWLFIKMFEKGLAYRKKSLVNWCPSCKTVLADEQVEAGLCERCKTVTEKKETFQWFFKITKYAQRLLDNIDKIDWPEKIKTVQRNWIGRSKGVEVDWQVKGMDKKVTTFTTRLDTIFGATFLCLAPEHPLVSSLTTNKAVMNYVKKALDKTEQQRKEGEKSKTGVDTGYKVTHPLTGKLMPIWIADFVLKDYGTGAVMGVPAHDERDMAFAKKHKLLVVDVLKNQDEVFKQLAKLGGVRKKINYRLRDWCISRQRYWGPPIPMIYCEKCKWQAEKEKNLPVKLPYVKDFKPTGDGKSPLQKAGDDWLYTKCPSCKGKAKRETDVSDTFLDSSWYFLRYPSVNHTPEVKKSATSGVSNLPFDPEVTKKWLPVDAYIRGAEHAVLHLMYSRFIWMALQDFGYIPKSLGDEPFPFLYGHGLIIKDGAKMSKSKGNIVNPDEYIDKYGVDALRMYLMFIGPYDQGGDFQDTGMKGMRRFLNRVWKLVYKGPSFVNNKPTRTDLEGLRRLQHQTVKRVTQAMKEFRFNVGIAALMEYVNELERLFTSEVKEVHTSEVFSEAVKTLILLLAPMAPYISEELWQKLGGKFSVHQQAWPEYDKEFAKGETVTVVIQVNAKLRDRLVLDREQAGDKEKVLAMAKLSEKVKVYLAGKKVVKEVFVPGKLVNLVV